ncbi:hypothetical protein HZC35_01250 [Candidatus Saganbacteria bacterium]|nr:hypothetical protein [Candidatus Saganbacteria bacterium]
MRCGPALIARYDWAKRFAQRMSPHLAAGRSISPADKIQRSFCYALLRSPFRNDQLISRGANNRLVPENPGYWVLDPLDGAVNYAHRLPQYALSLGYIYGGQPILGVVVKPTAKGFSVFSALSGCGLEVDGRPYNPHRPASRVGGLELRSDIEDPLLAGLPGLLTRFQNLRMPGSIASSLADVAQGALRFFAVSRPAIWEVAAALAILKEARCATNLEEVDLKTAAENDFDLPFILAATNRKTYNEVIIILQGALKDESGPKILATVDLSGRPI